MNYKSFLLLIIFLLCYNVSSQTILKSELIGEWLLSSDYDCPDLIELNSNGVYIIYNDCGATDPRLPITELGNWILKNNNLIFYDRDFKNKKSDFIKYHGTDDSLIFDIISLSEKILEFKFKSQENKIISEKYKRVKCKE